MKINHVEKDSIAASIGLKPGDRLESIDGSRVKDIIDYRFKVTDENILLRVRQGGKLKNMILRRMWMITWALDLMILRFAAVRMTVYIVLQIRTQLECATVSIFEMVISVWPSCTDTSSL